MFYRYELAYHDLTQPIGLCGCERSVKHYHTDTNFIFDNFTLYCAGTQQYNNLTFNLTGRYTEKNDLIMTSGKLLTENVAIGWCSIKPKTLNLGVC